MRKRKPNNIYCLNDGKELTNGQRKYCCAACGLEFHNKKAKLKRATNKAFRLQENKRRRDKRIKLTPEQRSEVCRQAALSRNYKQTKKVYAPKPKKADNWDRSTPAGMRKYLQDICPGFIEGDIDRAVKEIFGKTA
jgi:hypothetical protein